MFQRDVRCCCVGVANAATAGKAPAIFHLAPSKKEKKLDLGEAYLAAQQWRIESLAQSALVKQRCDLILGLTSQGKSADEIAHVMSLAGL
jgi:hypothetical protein